MTLNLFSKITLLSRAPDCDYDKNVLVCTLIKGTLLLLLINEVAVLPIRDIWMLMWVSVVPDSRWWCCRCWCAVTDLVLISGWTCAPSPSCWDLLSRFLPHGHMPYRSTLFPLPEWCSSSFGWFPWQLLSCMPLYPPILYRARLQCLSVYLWCDESWKIMWYCISEHIGTDCLKLS